jgi:predicted DNA-binding protein (MmcQ/YjbR family)
MIREHCLSLPHTTEQIQWGNHLLFKIGGKMFAITSLDYVSRMVTFKVPEEEFDELVERPGIMQAAYLAKRKWISVENEDAMPRVELRQRLTRSYELVKPGLTKKAQLELSAPMPTKRAVKNSPVRKRGVSA